MSDLFSKVSELLSDPEASRKIKSIADSLSGERGENPSAESSEDLPLPLSEGTPLGGDLLSALGPSPSHSREINLLNALRPYLRASRADKVDRALKAIRVIDLLSRIR